MPGFVQSSNLVTIVVKHWDIYTLTVLLLWVWPILRITFIYSHPYFSGGQKYYLKLSLWIIPAHGADTEALSWVSIMSFNEFLNFLSFEPRKWNAILFNCTWSTAENLSGRNLKTSIDIKQNDLHGPIGRRLELLNHSSTHIHSWASCMLTSESCWVLYCIPANIPFLQVHVTGVLNHGATHRCQNSFLQIWFELTRF